MLRNQKRTSFSTFLGLIVIQLCFVVIITNISCFGKNGKIQSKQTESDSIVYYKDVDWLSFNGLGNKFFLPLKDYPFAKFEYIKDTIKITAFLSPKNSKSLVLSRYGDRVLFYIDSLSNEVRTNKKVYRYTFLDQVQGRRINFNMYEEIRKDSTNFLNELCYTAKVNNKYINIAYGIRSALGGVLFRDIMSGNSKVMDQYFCHKYIWSENPVDSKVYIKPIENIDLCSEK